MSFRDVTKMKYEGTYMLLSIIIACAMDGNNVGVVREAVVLVRAKIELLAFGGSIWLSSRI